jgi:hypothetical protein
MVKKKDEKSLGRSAEKLPALTLKFPEIFVLDLEVTAPSVPVVAKKSFSDSVWVLRNRAKTNILVIIVDLGDNHRKHQ